MSIPVEAFEEPTSPPSAGTVAKIFIYGTLRRGEKYRYLITPFIVKERAASISGRLFHYAPDGGERGDYPYLTWGDGTVRGDVVELRHPTRAFRILDELENCPHTYLRERVRARYADGRSEEVWVYRIRKGSERPGAEIPSGDWLAECSRPWR